MPHMSLICHKKDIIYLQIQTRFEYNKFIGSTQSVPSQDFGTVNVTVTFLFVPCLETLADLTAGFPVTGLVFTVTIISGREILLINNVHSSTTSGLHFSSVFVSKLVHRKSQNICSAENQKDKVNLFLHYKEIIDLVTAAPLHEFPD